MLSDEAAGAQRLEIRIRLCRGDFRLEVDEVLPLRGTTVLFGPSGSGKSSLLRLIAGHDRLPHGRIALAGTVLAQAPGVARPPHRRPVATVFQDARLLDHLDVRGNLAFAARHGAARARRVRGAGTPPDLRALTEALGLGPLLRRAVAGLSGGERQRVALAQALASAPGLLLLDEPLAALDAPARAALLPWLSEVLRRAALPTLHVTHDVHELTRLADRVLLLDGGRVVDRGEPGAVVARLGLGAGAGRVEPGVLLEGTVRAWDGTWSLAEVACGAVTFVLPAARPLTPGAAVRLRIAARDVALALTRPRDSSVRNVLEARIDRIEAGETGTPGAPGPWVEVLLDAGGVPLRARITRRACAELGLTTGGRVHALVKAVGLVPALG